MILIVLGFAFLFTPSDLGKGAHPGVAPTWHALAFALPVAMLAYTGLETLANLAQEAREPGKTHAAQPVRSGSGAAVIVSVLIGVVGVAAFPAVDRSERRHDRARHATGSRRRCVGIVSAFNGHMPALLVDVLRVMVGLTGAGILLAAATTSISGCRPGRLLARPPPDAAARLRDVRAAEHAAARRRSSAPRPSRSRW